MNNNIKLIDRTSSTLTTETFNLDVDGKKIVYIEYQKESGKVIDEELRDEDGETLTNDNCPGNNVAALLEQIQKMFP
jgi:hypothetical protein